MYRNQWCRKKLHFFTIACIIFNILNLPLLHSKIQYSNIPKAVIIFSSPPLLTLSPVKYMYTSNYTYSLGTNYRVGGKLHTMNN